MKLLISSVKSLFALLFINVINACLGLELPEQGDCGIPSISSSINVNTLNRIINGDESISNSWPWIVSLRKTSQINNHFCAGTLIYERFILTAAHCVSNLDSNELAVVTGIHNIDQTSIDNTYQVASRYYHESYNSKLLTNDIAILLLKSNVTFSDKVKLACLPMPLNNDTAEAVVNKNVVVIGWGRRSKYQNTLSSTLQQGTMEVINGDPRCLLSKLSVQYDQEKIYCAIDISNSKHSICKGDSGGPLLYYMNSRWYLYGISSYAITGEGEIVCNNERPSYFTQVPAYLDWIEYGMNYTLSGKVQPKSSAIRSTPMNPFFIVTITLYLFKYGQ